MEIKKRPYPCKKLPGEPKKLNTLTELIGPINSESDFETSDKGIKDSNTQNGLLDPKLISQMRLRIVFYLTQRDHSEKELRTKLKKFFPLPEIEFVLTEAKQKRLIPYDESSLQTLSQKFGHSLHRKGKGIRYVNQALSKKGLPPISAAAEEEFEMALRLVIRKFDKFKNIDSPNPSAVFMEKPPLGRLEINKIRLQISRFLQTRGFQLDIIRKVINAYFAKK